jgi:alkanesulfonate monooxygenase SsuD/methylene tetrahydromethanopterin reductase-like flavin-dependent oxidoreductase (luciferase family)
VGEIGDGFLTVPQPMDYIKKEIFPKMKEGAEMKGRSFEDITKVIEMDVAFDEDYEKALAELRCYKPGLVPNIFKMAEYDPRRLEQMGNESVTDEELGKAYIIGSSIEEHIRKIDEAFNAGFDHVYVASNSPSEDEFFEQYRKHVIPYFQSS